VRVSLGGVRDEAEIPVTAAPISAPMPGKVIQSMRKAKTSNPLFLLDEIDKMGAISAATRRRRCLRFWTPSKNATSNDHYLEGRLRSVERHVHHDREYAEYSRTPDGPHGDHPDRRL